MKYIRKFVHSRVLSLLDECDGSKLKHPLNAIKLPVEEAGGWKFFHIIEKKCIILVQFQHSTASIFYQRGRLISLFILPN